MFRYALLFSLLLTGLCCGKKETSKAVSFSEPEAPADALFQYLAPEKTGVQFANRIVETHEDNILVNSYLYNGGGVGVIDFNNDGLQDLYFVSTQGACQLYQNTGNLQFKEMGEQAGVSAKEGVKTGVTIVDVNADGWQDIYLCRTGMAPGELRRNLLFVNNQNGTFSEKAAQFGLADAAASNHANFFDADLDGDLDCYVLNYPPDFKKVNSARVKPKSEGSKEMIRITTPENSAESDHFYINNGNGTFSEVSQERGIWNRAMGLSVTVSDLNSDGYPDIVVGNDYIEPDFVYMNNPARPGYFTDRFSEVFRHASNHTMGVDIADINNDGLNDVIALDMLAESYPRQKELMSTMIQDRYATLAKMGYGYQQMRNVLQLNNGNGTFSDVGCLAGVYQTDWSWGPLFMDFDNDGWRDLFIGNGYRRDVTNWDYLLYTADSIQRLGGPTPQRFPKITDYLNLIPETPLQNYMYRNQGDLRFENVSTAWGLTQLGYSNGSAYADLDNDGDMDLVVNNMDSPAGIYQNRAREMNKGGAWLQIKLQGPATNPFATGAKVRVTAGSQVQYAELSPTRGFFSSVEPLLHFGWGNVAQIDRIEVEFPGGMLAQIDQTPVNQRISITFANAKPGKIGSAPTAKNLFQAGPALAFVHIDDDAQDFNRERLLPWKTGNPGPALAVGDVNKDGLDDCFIGNGPNAAGAVFLQTNNGFRNLANPAFGADAALEDSGAVFMDVDGDGDQDLVVASGGNSFAPNSGQYPLRLYLNDGRGNFSKTAQAMPLHVQNIQALCALDYDRDGDPDLVAGGGVVAGAYPATPFSYLLRNDNGIFTDVTSKIAPDLAKIGMVRSIVQGDLNGDQTPELILAGEWMPIQVLALVGGKFTLAGAQYGLEASHGIWRSLALADIDKDGDLDLVAGNMGLNTRYVATPDAPLKLYGKDFDGNGSMDPIMTQTQNGIESPVAMRDILIKQLPALKKKFVRYSAYASATMSDVFAEKDLNGALELRCNTLASAVWINQNGRFVSVPLPPLAQVSPLYALQVADVDNDGDLDIIGAGNDYGQQVETGRLDAGNGVVLLNDGSRQFAALPARQSGLWATREARDAKILRGPGKKRWLVVANNSDAVQVFVTK